jgi:hypothetical protein
MKWCGHGRLFSKWFIGHLHCVMVWLGSRTAVKYCTTVCAACLNTYCTVHLYNVKFLMLFGTRTLFEPEPDLNPGPGPGSPICQNQTQMFGSGSGPGHPNPNRTRPRPVYNKVSGSPQSWGDTARELHQKKIHLLENGLKVLKMAF